MVFPVLEIVSMLFASSISFMQSTRTYEIDNVLIAKRGKRSRLRGQPIKTGARAPGLEEIRGAALRRINASNFWPTNCDGFLISVTNSVDI